MSKFQQHGSTLLGIIIGLIVGLAIAVVVALVITKGSSPFVNKVAKVASESASAQMGDPNKPLYSNKDAAKEAAKEFVKEPEAKPEVAKAPDAKPADGKPDAKPEAKPDAKPAEKSPEDKLDKLIAQVGKGDGKNEGKSDASEEKWTYYLQVGAFREQNDAENSRAKLALLGFEASINERNSDNGVLYRVRLGPYNQVEAMNKVRNKLSENGIDVAVVHNQK